VTGGKKTVLHIKKKGKDQNDTHSQIHRTAITNEREEAKKNRGRGGGIKAQGWLVKTSLKNGLLAKKNEKGKVNDKRRGGAGEPKATSISSGGRDTKARPRKGERQINREGGTGWSEK